MAELAEVMNDLKTKPVIPIWPHLGLLYGISRNAAYQLAKSGGVEITQVGKLRRVITAPLRKRLGIEAEAA